MMRLLRLPRAFARREDGNSTIEFVLVLPVLMTLFMMAFEAGWFMVKSTMLERSVNMAIRGVSLGHIANPTPASVKQAICERAVVLTDCEANIMMELRPISQTTWAMPPQAITCVNRDEPIQPALPYDVGANNDIMLVRVCILSRAIFPTTGLGAGLVRNAQGEIGLTAVQVYVNEPN
jgi:hypothetical protein